MAISLVGLFAAPSQLTAEEWEEHTPYYEDDALLDVTEWLDGNDYNPTDERFGVWDDEFYDSDAIEYDVDDDYLLGYDESNDADDWFYDYWEPPYWYYDADGDSYDHAYAYYDFDGDGVYDSITTYYDWDENGWYEDVNHYSFTTLSDDQKSNAGRLTAQASDRQSSKRTKITGEVSDKKTVSVRGTRHVVTRIKARDGTESIVDLGPEKGLQNVTIDTGAAITVEGPMTKAGDKPILLARKVTVEGKTHELDRNPRAFTGTVVDRRNVAVRGEQHTLLVLQLDNGKQRLVDLGRTDRLQEIDLRKDAQITVRGVPMNINDRPLVMAHSVEVDGTLVQIERGRQKQT
jgi:hypothetical protein